MITTTIIAAVLSYIVAGAVLFLDFFAFERLLDTPKPVQANTVTEINAASPRRVQSDSSLQTVA